MNKTVLMGRITADPEQSQTQSGKAVTRFTVAINRRFQKDTTDFINCVAWNNTAEFISKYFSKGNMIAVVGSIQTRTWEDKEGNKRYATEVNVDEAYFTGEKTEPKQSATPEFNWDDFESVSEDDLPF